MKIKVEIDKLILHDFNPQEQINIQNMIIQELTNILKDDNFVKNISKPLTFNVPALKISTTADPQKIGREVAHTIKTITSL
ncbi:MAG: hypothetical protein FWB84_06600 [Candidatus Bathyarchaeota archaeon]|uniref:hypothetical protein n=1 Tax=Candidatus Bathycorpusculum sp. TaxID=2994959 RepID=UPI00282F38CB|nr:hypothetical protein [Candidatus Termiticorpusculum sp.]MCL2292643.1 hypothetical protein [Candidatus Termiticorpusculum sp.]